MAKTHLNIGQNAGSVPDVPGMRKGSHQYRVAIQLAKKPLEKPLENPLEKPLEISYTGKTPKMCTIWGVRSFARF